MRSPLSFRKRRSRCPGSKNPVKMQERWIPGSRRSEEHTSELQSRSDLVCRLLLEKKKKNNHKKKRKESKEVHSRLNIQQHNIELSFNTHRNHSYPLPRQQHDGCEPARRHHKDIVI